MVELVGKTGYFPLPKDSNEQEQSAFVEVTKKNVLALLAADTHEVIPFYQRAEAELFKQYRSEPGRPNMPPLLYLRTANPEGEEETKSSHYGALLAALPQQLQEWLGWEMAMPAEERDPDFLALDALLKYASNFIGALESAATPPLPGSSEQSALQHYIALPYLVLRNGLATASHTTQQITEWLASRGHSYDNYDEMNRLLGEVNEQLQQLSALRKEIETMQVSPKGKLQLRQISARLGELRLQFSRAQTGSEMLLLGLQLDALQLIAQSFSQEFTSPSLFLALSSLYDADGSVASQLLPHAVDAALYPLISALLPADASPAADRAERFTDGDFRQLMQLSSTLVLLMGPVTGWLQGHGIDEGGSASRALLAEWSLELAIGARLPKRILAALLQPSGIEEGRQGVWSNLLDTSSLLLTLAYLSGGDQERLSALLLHFRDPLEPQLSQAIRVFESGGETMGSLSPEVATPIKSLLMAFQNGEESRALGRPVEQLLQALGFSPREYLDSIEEGQTAFDTLYERAQQGDFDEKQKTSTLFRVM